MPTSGLLILDKPYGMPSFKMVQLLKRRFRWQKIGHVGTLDPLATGVLPVCIGKATKLIPYLMERHKGYEALVRLGVDTQTQDREGGVTRIYCGRDYPSIADVEETLKGFRGEIKQIPPMYSALRYQGRRLYEWARDGHVIPRNPRKVFIDQLRCLAYDYPFLLIDVSCGKGTYIRTLAADIGWDLGTGGHLWALKRLSVGGYTMDQALPWEQVMGMTREEMESYFIPMGEILSFLPLVTVDHEEKEAMKNGRSFLVMKPQEICPLNGFSLFRVQDQEGEFLGLGSVVSDQKNGFISETYIKPSLVVVHS